MIAALTDGIKDAAAGATGFTASRVHYGEAPLKTGYPYLIIFGIEHDFDLDGINQHEKARAQFSVRDSSLAKVQTAGAAQQDVFDLGESNITVTGWTVLESIRILSIPPRKFNNVWAWDMDYNIWIYKARS